MAIVSVIEPFSPNLHTLLGLQFAGGLASGFFVPLTLSFILRNTPPKAWAYGVAIYALNLEVSLNVSAALEGWYLEHPSWAWIFWQNVPLAASMALCLHFGVSPDPANPARPPPDIFGLASGGIALALIYAALDQGNRLDWSNSGLVWGLVLAGAVLLIAFLVHELHTPHPGIDLRLVLTSPMPRLLLLIAFLHRAPQAAINSGAGTQVARLMGGEVGTAFIVTFIRVRSQIASTHLGLHVPMGDGQVAQRLQIYAAVPAPAGNSGPARGAAVLGSVVHSMAVTQGIIDAFVVIAALTAATLILIVTPKSAPPRPASPGSPFARRVA